MDRLTQKVEALGDIWLLENGKTKEMVTDSKEYKEYFEKLAEYEELEEQGLLIRLPCKVGDTVYVIANCGHVNKKLDGTLYDLNGGYGTATGYYCPYEDCCPHDCDEFTCCEDYAEKEAILEDIVLSICLEETGLTVFTENLGACGYVGENFIFLIRKQAEKKLKELQKEGANNEQIS